MTKQDSERFTDLTEDQAKNWIEIARALHDVESVSKVSADGRSWQDILMEHLEALGHPISVGHLGKIRRAYGFLIKHAPADIDNEQLLKARISAVEVAERLYRIDPEQGTKALEDILSKEPVAYVELQVRYDKAVKKHPQKRSLRHLAWEARRESASAPKYPADFSEPLMTAASEKRWGPPEYLQTSAADLIQQAWTEGWNEAKRQSDPALAEKDQKISELTATIALLKGQGR